MEILSRFVLGDMTVTYLCQDGRVGMVLLPADLGAPAPGPFDLEPLVLLALAGSAASGGFAAGHTLRGGDSDRELKFVDQREERGEGETRIVTRFNLAGVEFRHVLEHPVGARGLRSRTEVVHRGGAPLVFEMLSSFSLGGLSPFPDGREPGALVVHRLRSTWSNEGRLVSEDAEDLQLEPSWSLHGVRVERFGQVGSLPVRKFFPFAAVEDRRNGVVWAAQVATPGSWQIELWRRNPALALSGGLADAELGHWTKTLEAGQAFFTPWAHLTVAGGSLDQVSQRLVDLVRPPGNSGTDPLPQVFNEFCSTWGRPSEQSILGHLGALRGRGLDYYVIDAGWYGHPQDGWELGHGDWVVGPHLFPRGLAAAARAIRDAGLVPGLWFEVETCGPRSEAYHEHSHLLHRAGVVVTSGHRRFWNMADPWVRDRLGERVIARLREGFGYIKVDYNESFGMGCDGAESPGEGLRAQLEATQEFFRRLRTEVPGIVIESCASGGHRLEPSMMGLSDFSSFSDAHECPEIPVLAANLHRVVPPAHFQIWAVLRQGDSVDRIVYSMAATFLGVLCLSGEVDRLSATQWDWVDRGLAFHRRVSPLLRTGTTSWFGPPIPSYRRLEGWQALVRDAGGAEVLVVVHRFGGEDPGPLVVDLPWAGRCDLRYGTDERMEIHGTSMSVRLDRPFTACAFLVVREDPTRA